MGNSSPPMPNANANRTWSNEALFSENVPSATTIWFIGFLRVPITAAFTFQLNTSVQAAMYLSTDENPANAVRIATNTILNSARIVLQNNTE